MNEFERKVGWLIDLGVASLVAGAAGWSALHWASPLSAVAVSAAAFVVGSVAMNGAARFGRGHHLPALAMPEWPEAEPLPEGVVALKPKPRPLPTPGELGQRIQAHLEQRPAPTAEVIPLRADGTAALREALAGLKQART